MQATPIAAVHRRTMTSSVADEVREMIVDGRLPPGGRVNEVHLAAALGISRTPLREALMKLTAEGALVSVPQIGFQVSPLSVEELEQIYPIREILDPEALRLSGIPSPERMQRLEELNAKMRKTRGAAAVIALDDAWHFELLAGCPNRVLLALIEQFMRRTRRYELAYMREQKNVAATTTHHDLILSKLRKRDLRGACAAVRKNMQIGMEPIAAWLREKQG
ncbi:MAG TPA: GntR family transcriptional regulator [Thermoanaerobaculia bacterium]|nr:GntR family transcriptional regulator [Thermoanaerobaculia bacterium]